MNKTTSKIVKEYIESLEGSYVAKDYSYEAREELRAKFWR